MNAYKNVSFVGIVLFLFGIVIAIYGFKFLLEKNELEKNGIVVKGVVIDINHKDIYRSPFVRFTTKDNRTITFLSRLEVNVDLFKYKIGQEVEVIYDKNNPNNCQINAFWEKNMPQIFLGSFGLFLMLLGIFIRKRFLKKARRYDNR
jgi:hypothetical protein